MKDNCNQTKVTSMVNGKKNDSKTIKPIKGSKNEPSAEHFICRAQRKESGSDLGFSRVGEYLKRKAREIENS